MPGWKSLTCLRRSTRWLTAAHWSWANGTITLQHLDTGCLLMNYTKIWSHCCLVRRASSKYRVCKSRDQLDERLAGTPNRESFMNPQEIKTTVKTFILNEYLPGEDPAALTDATPLMTTGILDSIAVLKIVTFLENQFHITIEPHEAVVENLNTLSDIERFVMSKKAWFRRCAQAARRSFVSLISAFSRQPL